ncbi:TetR/AcrR family transcriptional regulator [Mumia sp. zg.B53]|uniref:TetR/AcrR family transcriptional regulator n=1 Tax=unclassified Mumia TaxID=2621872 RepID=UPI001C6EF50D|nr:MULTISPECIES: TetR/AcrR family transcriptional regulator [unclassified Mumia]MBW9210722.1 TetR/AcrR family transcriptional regulator [Mumia sp. zg.B21]MBW9215336.1 TetR/AcrR family transcriptional regulator [Mumia sp. zg.B53]
MGRSSKAQSEVNRAHLVHLACALFAEHGYDAVGLEEVAVAAGQTRGAVYHHFGSKRGLFSAALAKVQASVGDAVQAAALAESDPWEGLVAGCHAFLDAAASDGARRVMLVDGPAVLGWQEWRDGDAASSRRLLEEGLHQLGTRGDVAPDEVAALATLLSGAMNETALWLAQEGEPVRDAAHAGLDRVLTGLRRR